MKKNKYEDIKMIDLEDKVNDILEIYISRLYHTDKTVGIVVNKETAEYFLDELVKIDETSIKEVDLVDYMEIDEYLVSVDDDGYITCVPIEDYVVLDKTNIIYIDMDGDILQDVIDYCVDEDKEVILFGQEYGDCENCLCENKPSTTSTAAYKVNGKEVSEDEYYDKLAKYEELDSLIDRYNVRIELLDNLYKIFGF